MPAPGPAAGFLVATHFVYSMALKRKRTFRAFAWDDAHGANRWFVQEESAKAVSSRHATCSVSAIAQGSARASWPKAATAEVIPQRIEERIASLPPVRFDAPRSALLLVLTSGAPVRLLSS